MQAKKQEQNTIWLEQQENFTQPLVMMVETFRMSGQYCPLTFSTVQKSAALPQASDLDDQKRDWASFVLMLILQLVLVSIVHTDFVLVMYTLLLAVTYQYQVQVPL